MYTVCAYYTEPLAYSITWLNTLINGWLPWLDMLSLLPCIRTNYYNGSGFPFHLLFIALE